MSAVTTVIKNLVESYAQDGITAAQINHGYCADLACVVWEQTGATITDNEEVDGSEYSHTFISDGGKFYDSEFPDGESDFSVFMMRFTA